MKRKKLISIAAFLLSLLMAVSLMGNIRQQRVQAASSGALKEQLEELENQNEELQNKIDGIRDQLSDNLTEMQQIVEQKDLVDQEISLLNEQIQVLNNQISAYSLLIADKQEELEAAEAELKQLQVKNKQRIRAMEENGELSYWEVLFEASTFTEMLDQLEIVQEIAEADRLCLQEMDAAAKKVSEAREVLAAEQAFLQEKRTAMDETQAQLEEKRAETDSLLIQLKAKGDEYEQMLLDSEQLQEDLAAEIALKRDEYEDAKYKEWLATSKPTGGTAGVGNVVGGQTWLVPCSYSSFTSPFGYRYHPISGDWRMHNGVDLAGPEGTPIVATRAGYVTIASYQQGGAGYYVALSHGDGFGSIYMHMTHYIVSTGQYVDAGEVIGYMGSTGGSTGSHLHFGISYNGVYVNPADYINIT